MNPANLNLDDLVRVRRRTSLLKAGQTIDREQVNVPFRCALDACCCAKS
jgi:hypothetical protein